MLGAWVLAVVVTGLVADRAVAVLDTQTSRPGVMSAGEVERALAAARAAVPTPTAGATTPPAPTTSPTASPAPAPSDPVSRPTTGPIPSSPPATAARTWSVAGGTVAASCTGGAISLLYATPADGWTVEVGSAGPQRVEVELRQPGLETKVVALCSAGVPQHTVDAGAPDAADDGSSDG
ncbi:MAG: hypothetical protein BGO37_08875 [Cellulomonas sp. 73-92]|uniref:hypothetical protein n=1 Tax=Cellulomonas sp. 73-92 TaxID=1895740 RepID=UPI00092610D4|nr:hypothetical protein [Cellulomonas sp. 73-92]OJV83381.1 MAG: hypothetical protein BGO37_08875 [Cellulomonas sp. 73-92]